jgi:hypothetical protein
MDLDAAVVGDGPDAEEAQARRRGAEREGRV